MRGKDLKDDQYLALKGLYRPTISANGPVLHGMQLFFRQAHMRTGTHMSSFGELIVAKPKSRVSYVGTNRKRGHRDPLLSLAQQQGGGYETQNLLDHSCFLYSQHPRASVLIVCQINISKEVSHEQPN